MVLSEGLVLVQADAKEDFVYLELWKFLARETKKDITEVVKDGKASYVLTEKTKDLLLNRMSSER